MGGRDNTFDKSGIGVTLLFRRRRETCIGRQAWIGVDLKDRGRAIGAATEIDAGIAAEAEQCPCLCGERVQGRVQFRLTRRPGKIAYRLSRLERSLIPFGAITDDARPVRRPIGKAHLRDGEDDGDTCLIQQGDIEFAAGKKFLREPEAAIRGSRGGGAGDDGATAREHRAIREADGGILPRRFDDVGQIIAQTLPIGWHGPCGCGKTGGGEAAFAFRFVPRQHQSGCGRTGAGNAERGEEKCRGLRRLEAGAIDRLHQIEQNVRFGGQCGQPGRIGHEWRGDGAMATAVQGCGDGIGLNQRILLIRRGAGGDVGMKDQHPHLRPPGHAPAIRDAGAETHP